MYKKYNNTNLRKREKGILMSFILKNIYVLHNKVLLINNLF